MRLQVWYLASFDYWLLPTICARNLYHRYLLTKDIGSFGPCTLCKSEVISVDISRSEIMRKKLFFLSSSLTISIYKGINWSLHVSINSDMWILTNLKNLPFLNIQKSQVGLVWYQYFGNWKLVRMHNFVNVTKVMSCKKKQITALPRLNFVYSTWISATISMWNIL